MFKFLGQFARKEAHIRLQFEEQIQKQSQKQQPEQEEDYVSR